MTIQIAREETRCITICGMVHIKEPLLLIGKSSPCSDISRFPLSLSEWSFTICPCITVNKIRKEGNVLFNNAFNTFYLRLYGVRHMAKDHSDSNREETRCHHKRYSFRLAARVFYMHHSTDRIAHTRAFFYTSRGTLAGTRNSSMDQPHEGSIRQPIAPWVNALTKELHLAPCLEGKKCFI